MVVNIVRHRSSSVGSQQHQQHHSEVVTVGSAAAAATATTTTSPNTTTETVSSNNNKRTLHNPMINKNNSSSSCYDDFEVTKRLLSSILYLKDGVGRSFLHTQFHLSWAKALLDRAKKLDDCQEQQQQSLYQHTTSHNHNNSSTATSSSALSSSSSTATTLLQRRFLLQPDGESGYTPLHRAVMEGNLSTILFLLRHAMDTSSTDRLTQRPMSALHTAEQYQQLQLQLNNSHHQNQQQQQHQFSGIFSSGTNHGPTTATTGAPPSQHAYNNSNNNNSSSSSSSSSNTLLLAMATATDYEGLTPFQLMGYQQQSELARCRKALAKHFPTVDGKAAKRLFRPRQASFDCVMDADYYSDKDEMDARRDYFSENGDLFPSDEPIQDTTSTANQSFPTSVSPGTFGLCEYACEVVTYGRPHHCALGVVQGGGGGGNTYLTTSTTTTANTAVTVAGSVTTSSRTTTTATTSSSSKSHHTHSSTFCPQRVKAFAQETVGREGGAVAVAAAPHHTLVVAQNGHVYVCGLEKGGRLGLGDDQPQQCPLPRRILGSLQRRNVVAVAAAENHSLCVTDEGHVYGWGSNRFGQLGDSTPTTTSTISTAMSATGGGNGRGSSIGDKNSGTTSGGCRSLPRRVEVLKHNFCVAVAAGERHSVALTRKGEVYVWGDNSSGQLGVPRRSGIQKVQRVEGLWNQGSNQHVKIAIAIAASDQSTLVLTGPIPGLTQVNTIYEWGHGNHVPMRVHFDNSRLDGSSGGGANRRDGVCRSNSKTKSAISLSSSSSSFTSYSRRVVNPVAIACGKYHNVAITTDGLVYSWGLHAESLGRSCPNFKSQKGNEQHQLRRNSLPELVTGMLPQKGGGFAVAIAASDQHTAVVCNNGALFTWGTSDGKNVLGHEGVRWQPNPKRVPGVHRAVNVAVAKEHTVLLIGTSFPTIPKRDGLLSLELVAARKTAQHVDLFNVVPIMIMAERTECQFLIEYCSNFLRRNLDGVLNVGKRSELNQYLEDKLADTTYRSGKRYRDDHHHPFIFDVLTAGNKERPSFDRDWFSNIEEWTQGCKELFKSHAVQSLLALADIREYEEDIRGVKSKARRSSSCRDEYQALKQRARSSSFGKKEPSEVSDTPKRHRNTLDQCIRETANMDLSTIGLVLERSEWLAREIRSVRKKLKQITNLQEVSEGQSIILALEQKAKVDRRPTLEAELSVYESAMEEVEKRMKELKLQDSGICPTPTGSQSDRDLSKTTPLKVTFADDPRNEVEAPASAKGRVKFFCEHCQVKCSDQSNLILHQNGRRHRNRVAQAEEDEKKLTAKLIIDQQKSAQFKSVPVHNPRPQKAPKQVWGISSSQPTYKLPPPPHPVVELVTTDLYKEFVPKSQTAKTLSATKASISPASNFMQILKEQEEAKTMHPSKRAPPTTAVPVWETSPGSTRCVPLSLYASSKPGSKPVESPFDRRVSVSLADFLTPSTSRAPVPPVSASLTTPCKSIPQVAPWTSPQAEKSVNSKSIMQIQAEEENLRARQDKSYGKGGGSWFVERRERADSLVEIQKCAKEDLEHRLLVEEQLRIEAQIHEELRRQKEDSTRKNGKGRQRRSNKESLKGNAENSPGLDSGVKPSGDMSPKNSNSKQRQSRKSQVLIGKLP